MIKFWLDMLMNEGTSTSLSAKLVALGTGIAAAGIAAAVLLAGQWIYRRFNVSI